MRTVLTILFVSIIILSGCVGVDGEPIDIPDGQVMYDGGFIDGCMSSILMLTTPQNLPPYDEAIETCIKVYEAAVNGNLGDMPSEQMSTPIPVPEPVIVCNGNCI
jgi:hypothetical protein